MKDKPDRCAGDCIFSTINTSVFEINNSSNVFASVAVPQDETQLFCIFFYTTTENFYS